MNAFRRLLLVLAGVVLPCCGGSGGATTHPPGPVITLTTPVADVMIDQAPGTLLAVEGTVINAGGLTVTSFTVNGNDVPLVGGAFSTDVTLAFGLNALELVAVNSGGGSTELVVPVLAAADWHDPAIPFAGMVQMLLRNDDLDPLVQVIEVKSTPEKLEAALDAWGLSITPVAHLGTAPTEWDVNYVSAAIGGRSLSVANAAGALTVTLTFTGIDVILAVTGFSSGTVHLTATSFVLSADIVLGVDGGNQLTATIDEVTATLNGVNPTGGGFLGALLNVLTDTVGNQLDEVMEDLTLGQVVQPFAVFLEALAIRNLPAAVPVARLAGAAVPLSSATDYVAAAFVSTGLQTAHRVLFDGLTTVAEPTLGVALNSYVTVPTIPGNASESVVAQHEALFNYFGHELWRGGYFDLSAVPGGFLSSLPVGGSFDVHAALPPVVVLGAGTIDVSLALRIQNFVLPGVVSPAIPLSVCARVRADLGVESGDGLTLNNLTEIDFAYASNGAALTVAQRTAIDPIVRELVNDLIVGAYEAGLAVSPRPSFHIDAALAAELGLAAENELGVWYPPDLSTTAPWWFQVGTLSVR